MATDERRHQVEEKTYAVFTADSVITMAESAGFSAVPQEAASALGEDASYRMRQVIMHATQYMKHSKRRRLGVDDFNIAAKDLNAAPVFGHGSQDSVPFRYSKEADLHYVEDPEVKLCDVALGNYVPRNIGMPSIKSHWLAVEGVVKTSNPSGTASQGKSNQPMSPSNLAYYTCMTKALLGVDARAKKRALQDLKTSPKLVPVLPYIINFVVSGIKNMSHDITHLTTMLNTIRALLHNRFLYLMHKPYLATIVQGVEFCVVEPLVASMNSVNDHWSLRDYAARLLAEIVHRWNSPQNHLRFNVLKSLKEVLYDTKRPFYAHYGAIMTLIAMGHKSIEDVIVSHLPVYWTHLKAAMEDNSVENIVAKSDSHKVFGALRLAAEKLMLKCVKEFEKDVLAHKEEMQSAELLAGADAQVEAKMVKPEKPAQRNCTKSPFVLYKELEEYFGDSLSLCLPLVDTSPVFKPSKKEEVVSLGDKNSGKGGEELLNDLMEQIYLQEKLEKERKERELKEREEREKLEQEQRIREALERKKREEEERIKRREEEEMRRKYEFEQAVLRRRKEEEEKRRREWEEQMQELNESRNRPQVLEFEEASGSLSQSRNRNVWKQEIELRQQQLKEEMQYSRMMEAAARKKREDEIARTGDAEKLRRLKEEDDKFRDDDEDHKGRGRLRRRKPVNYTEKDEDISDLFEDRSSTVARQQPRFSSTLPPHSDISDESDLDESKKPVVATDASLAISSMINQDPAKGIKIKIKRQSTHSASPPYPLPGPPYPLPGTPQHSSPAYHSPSVLSPRQSSTTALHSTPPSSSSYPRSKSSSGSDKESKYKKSAKLGRTVSISSTGFGEPHTDPDEPVYERPHGSIPPQLYSPGGESSGSDSNPHRKALKLKFRLTPNHTPSE